MPPDITGIGDEAASELQRQISAARTMSWSALELRTVNGVALADLEPHAQEEMAETLYNSGIAAACLASRIGNWARPITSPWEEDLAELETLARQCAMTNCHSVRIMSYPNNGLPDDLWRDLVVTRIKTLAQHAEQLGVVLLHENCSGWAGTSADRMLELVEVVDSPALRLLFDIGNGVAHGYDSYAMLQQVLPHVAHVHVKDAVTTDSGVLYTLPGLGEARVDECLRLLVSSGYRGWLSLEPHLSTRPHEGVLTDGDGADLFLEAGRRLDRMLHREMTAMRTSGPIDVQAP